MKNKLIDEWSQKEINKIIKNLSKFSHKNQNQEIQKIQNQPGSSMD
jgi:hypothetical protein